MDDQNLLNNNTPATPADVPETEVAPGVEITQTPEPEPAPISSLGFSEPEPAPAKNPQINPKREYVEKPAVTPETPTAPIELNISDETKPAKFLNIDTSEIKNFALNFIVPIVCVGVVVLQFAFLIYPLMNGRDAVNTELTTKTVLKGVLTSKLTLLNKLIDYKSMVDENSTLINKVLVSEDMVPELLSQVDAIARDSGLAVTRLSYSLSTTDATTTGYPSVDVSMGAQGTSAQFVFFLRSVEEAARLVDVSSFRYSSGGQDPTQLSFNIVFRSPYLFVTSEAVVDEPITLDVTSTKFADFMGTLKALKYYDPKELEAVTVVEEVEESTASKTASQ